MKGDEIIKNSHKTNSRSLLKAKSIVLLQHERREEN